MGDSKRAGVNPLFSLLLLFGDVLIVVTPPF